MTCLGGDGVWRGRGGVCGEGGGAPTQFMNCVYPSAPVTITSIQILMASGDGATMK